MSGAVAVALAAVALIVGAIAVLTRSVVSTPAERTVHAALHTASLAARSLRKGLDADSAAGAAPRLCCSTSTAAPPSPSSSRWSAC